MRQLGEIVGRPRADRFLAFLAKQGIEATLRDDGDERYGIWVIDEDHLADADQHYRAYKASPEASVFDAPPLPRQPQRPSKGALGRSRHIDVRREVFGRGAARKMPVTVVFIGLSVLLTLAANLPELRPLTNLLYYSQYFGRDFPELASGQVWRLVTPIFLHGGIMHLLFNMLWLYQLGGTIEQQEGSVYFGFMTLVIAALVDTAEYLVAGPSFIGMSGVVYALFGYVWMMSRFAAGTRYFLPRETVIIMLGWLVVCLVGLIPGVANTEHVAGLVVGVVWGFLRSGHLGTLTRRRRYRG